jgi:carbon-monoxide dehydrogenase large subunit
MMLPALGRRLPRREDDALLDGTARFVSDIRLPGALHLGMVRSTDAHAEIQGIDTRGASGAYTYTAADLPTDLLNGMRVVGMPKGVHRTLLATDRVRFVGDPVAAVLAPSQYALQDALSTITCRLEPLPAVVTIEDALAVDAPRLFPEVIGNTVYDDRTAIVKEMASRRFVTDIGNAAVHRMRRTVRYQRCLAAPLESFACAARWENGRLTLWVTTQSPHLVRANLADVLGLPETRIRVIAPEVGGSFGSKNAWYPEIVLVAWLALQHDRPVRYAQTRTEATVALCHGRDQEIELEAAYDNTGRIRSIRGTILQNCGAYPTLDGVIAPKLGRLAASGPYAIEDIDIGVAAVATNTTPIRPMRGTGRPEITTALEHLVDSVARELNVGPYEIRHRNVVPADGFPYTSATGPVYDSGDYPALLVRLRQLLAADERDIANARAVERTPEMAGVVRRGIGVAMFIDLGGLGPSRFVTGETGRRHGGWEMATFRLLSDGSATVEIGTSPQGQGHETMFAELVRLYTGLPGHLVHVQMGDTDVVPNGVGTFGARSAVVGGSALHEAMNRVLAKARLIAAHHLGLQPEEMVLSDGRFHATDDVMRSISLHEIARLAYSASDLPEGVSPGLEATVYWDPPSYVYSSGAYGAVVSVDTSTGVVRVEKFVAVDDCGNQINPLLVEGQVRGGVAQGIGQALFEEARYSEVGSPLFSGFEDYLVPTAADLPSIVTAHVVTPSPYNALGIKGVGESGAVGAPAAVLNAVVDALAPLGVSWIDPPATPERVLAAIELCREQSRAGHCGTGRGSLR